MLEVVQVAAAQQGCVTYSQFRAAGWSRHAIAHRLETERIQRLHRSVYRLIDGNHYPFTKHMAAALGCGRDTSFVRGGSALWVFGAIGDDPPEVDITIPGARRSDRPGLRIHGDRLHRLDTGDCKGVPITSPARALLDTARQMDRDDFAWVVNEAIIKELVTTEDLLQVIERSPRHPGAKVLRTAAGTNPIGDQSKLNRLTAEALARGGVPAPERNVVIAGWNVDFAWRDCNLILEADGFRFHRHAQSLRRDRRKQSDLELLGHRFLRTDWDEVTQRPEAMVGRVLLARAQLAA